MMRRINTLMFGLFVAVLLAVSARAEVYPGIDDSVRFYIDVPDGQLTQLLHWSPGRMPMVSQHRGGPMPGYPENAIETLDNAVKYGPGIMEVDVATLSDGTLILMHDNTLDRTTTGEGDVSKKSWTDVRGLNLVDDQGQVTGFVIPTLRDTLLWAKDRAILNLDIKRGTDFVRVMELVRTTGTIDNVMAITYSLEQAVAYNKIAPEVMLSVQIRSATELKTVKEAGLPLNRVVAWAGLSLLPSETYDLLHKHGLMVMQGTLGFDDTAIDEQIKASGDNSEYMRIVGHGADIIATDRHWAAQQAIRFPALVYFVRGVTAVRK